MAGVYTLLRVWRARGTLCFFSRLSDLHRATSVALVVAMCVSLSLWFCAYGRRPVLRVVCWVECKLSANSVSSRSSLVSVLGPVLVVLLLHSLVVPLNLVDPWCVGKAPSRPALRVAGPLWSIFVIVLPPLMTGSCWKRSGETSTK